MSEENRQEEILSILECRRFPLEYTDDQLYALELVEKFLLSDDKFFLLAGSAGTGKTSIAENIAAFSGGVLLAPTNAAVMRLKERLPDNVSVSTIHKTLYGAPDPKTGKWIKKGITPNTTYIIDESSMIDETVLDDIITETYDLNNKVIFLGDSFQLPPVGKDPFLFKWEKSKKYGHNFLKENKVELLQVKRQDGEILNVATKIRTSKSLDVYDYKNEFKVIGDKFGHELYKDIDDNNDYAVITFSNPERMKFNTIIRKYKFGDIKAKNIINEGDYIISVANNDKLNGERYVLHDPIIVESFLDREVNVGSFDYPEMKKYDFYHIYDRTTCEHTLLIPNLDKASIHGYQLLQYFDDYDFSYTLMYNGANKDGTKRTKRIWNKALIIATYGYALTAHKAQGSEWDNVYINPKSVCERPNKEHIRWFYTAITRGKKRVRLQYHYLLNIVDDPKNAELF